MIEVSGKETAPAAPKAAKSDEEKRRVMLSEVRGSPQVCSIGIDKSQKAETLRTRLQLALYKVQTNQTSKPFSRLTHPREWSPEPAPQAISSSPLSSPRRRGHFSSMSPESKIAIARARATMQAKQHTRPLEKVTHPTIVPTAFSARRVENDSASIMVIEIPSSPPVSNGSDIPRLVSAGAQNPLAEAKIVDGTDLPKTPIQLSSPPGSPEVKLSTATKRLKSSKYGGLTSSVVKGEAASGLLELMRG